MSIIIEFRKEVGDGLYFRVMGSVLGWVLSYLRRRSKGKCKEF